MKTTFGQPLGSLIVKESEAGEHNTALVQNPINQLAKSCSKAEFPHLWLRQHEMLTTQ